jgi:hypothetical protein
MLSNRRRFRFYFSILTLVLGAFGFSVQKEAAPYREAKSVDDLFVKEAEIRLEATPESSLDLITDMEIDSKNHFLVTDGWQRRQIFIFDSKGKYLGGLGTRGQGPGEYQTPVSLAINSRGEIWVLDYLQSRIEIWDRDYRFLRVLTCKSRVNPYIHLNGNNEIFLYSSNAASPAHPVSTPSIKKFDDQGRQVLEFAPSPEEIVALKYWISEDGMTIDPAGFIFEMNPLFYQIRKFNSAGVLIKTFSRKTPIFHLEKKEGAPSVLMNGPFFLEKGFLIAQVGEYLEIYDPNGNLIAGELQFAPKIIATKGNVLYARREADADKTGEADNPVLFKYRLRD